MPQIKYAQEICKIAPTQIEKIESLEQLMAISRLLYLRFKNLYRNT